MEDTLYYTFDTNECTGSPHLAQNATIHSAKGASVDDLIQTLEAEQGLTGVRVEEGYWGDCWIKSYRAVTDDDIQDICTPFTPDQISVQVPGTHPGGKAWWLTPSVSVYAVEFEAE